MFQTDVYQLSVSVYKGHNVALSKLGIVSNFSKKITHFGLFDQFQGSNKSGLIKHYLSQLLS